MAKGIPDAERRRTIMEGSRALFFERGVSALTMDQIASLQGISKKTLYRFFPNKDSLVAAVVEDRITFIAAEAARIGSDSRRSYLERLRDILGLVGMQLSQISETMIKDIWYSRPDLWNRIDKFRQEHVFGIITRMLAEGRREGFIRDDIDGRLIPVLFTSAISTVLTPAQMIQLTIPPIKLFDVFVRILFGGILTDSARRKFFSQEGKV
ncbi:MAG TPA: TetR/AcrR family transcriptional regulator [Spirochaetia bacterium]|nr:TetR/AcrR family transcriptional regulator [Spirochaetia bacterium]